MTIDLSRPLGAIAEQDYQDLKQFNPGEVLLWYQKKWIADDSVLKIAQKSRRTGLTWAQAADDVLAAATARDQGGCNCFYVGSNKEMAREYIEAAAMWAKAFDRAAGEIQEEVFEDEGKDGKEILTYVIYFASGFKVQALSSKPSNLRGMQGNVTIDEAAFHERLAEVLKAALALTMWGSKVRLISTHNGVDNLFNTLIKDSLAGRKRYSVHTITLDHACDNGLYQRICQRTGAEWSQAAEDEWKAGLLKDTATEEDAQEEYYCVPKQGSGSYLPYSLIERAQVDDIPVLTLEAPADFMNWTELARNQFVSDFCEQELAPVLAELPDLRHSFGEDFARKGDLSVFTVMTILADTRLRVAIQVELRNLTYAAQESIMFFILRRLPRLCGAAFDATGNGGYLAEAAALKFGTEMVDQVMLNLPWYRDWMPKLKARFEEFEIQIPKTDDVRTDLRKIVVKQGVAQIEKGSGTGADGGQRHGDSAVSLCMAVRATYMDGAPIDFQGLPPKKDRWDSDPDGPDSDYPDDMQGAW
jgi:phage FluMu gp28-like protein